MKFRNWFGVWCLFAVTAFGQNPQTQTAPIFAANSKYVNGVAPGYMPCGSGAISCPSVTGLNFYIGSGTTNCGGTMVTYAGGTFTLTASTVNYIYLNTGASCAPAVKTTTYTSSDIPIAMVTTGSSTVTGIVDDRTIFNAPSGGGGGCTPSGAGPFFLFDNESGGCDEGYILYATLEGGLNVLDFAASPSGSGNPPDIRYTFQAPGGTADLSMNFTDNAFDAGSVTMNLGSGGLVVNGDQGIQLESNPYNDGVDLMAPTGMVNSYSLTFPSSQWSGCLSNDGSGNLSGVSCGGGGGGPTISTNSVNNPDQTVLNFETSTANSVGLVATPVNPSGGIEKFEISGGNYTGTAALATSIAGGAANDIPYQTGAGVTSFVAPVNSAVVVTNGSGVPSESTTLPSGLTIPGYASSTASTTVNGATCTLGSSCNVNGTNTAHGVALNEGTGTALGQATIGTAGRLLIDQGAGVDPAFEAVSQDCTITSLGVTTCLKTNNVAFSGLATLTETDGNIPVGAGGVWTKSPTPALGADNSVAGTLQLANNSANAHTVLGSAATTSNTFLFPATAPTNLHCFYAAVSGTTTTLTDCGYAYNSVPLADLATQVADTLVMNGSGSTASPTAVSLPTATGGADLYNTSTHSWSNVLTNVTNDAQTKAAVVPNTTPSAGQILVGNAGGTAYAPLSISQDCTITSSAVMTCTKTNNVSFSGLATLTETDGDIIFGSGGSWTKGTALPSGTTATTQSAGDNSTKVATTAYVDGHFIANGTSAMGTSAISSGTCATVVTSTATGVATTDVIVYTPNTDPTAVTGYGPSATGSLYIWAYPTSGNVNFKVCNNTSSTITPSALTLNWKVTR